MRDPVVSLLADLVAIPSVNPSLVPGAAGEAAIAEFLAARLARSGIDVEVQAVGPGRPNVVGVLEGPGPGPTLLLCGHVDTVGAGDMDAPFDPIVTGGRMRGRGAQDMKGGVAAMVHAVERLASRGGPPRGRVLVAAVVDEEYASIGAESLVARWTADAAIVTEPTDLQVGIAHKGFSAAEIVLHGRAAHGSRPAEGRDAILAMGHVLQALAARDRELQAGAPHELLGTASLHASTIQGGTELSSYPARCTLHFERRTLPGELPTVAEHEAVAICRGVAHQHPDIAADVRLLLARRAYAVDPQHPLPLGLMAAARSIGADPAPIGLSFWTDAALLGEAGIATVIYGPGGAGLHGPDEYVELAQVTACRDVLLAWLLAES